MSVLRSVSLRDRAPPRRKGDRGLGPARSPSSEHRACSIGSATRRASSSRSPSWDARPAASGPTWRRSSAFGFAIERHPYLGRGLPRAGRAALPRPDRARAGHAAGRPADRGLEPGRQHQRPGGAGRGARRPTTAWSSWPRSRPRAGADAGRAWTAPPRSSILMSVLLFPPPSSPARPRGRRGLRLAHGAGRGRDGRGGRELDRARRPDQVAQRRPGGRPEDRRHPRRARTPPSFHAHADLDQGHSAPGGRHRHRPECRNRSRGVPTRAAAEGHFGEAPVGRGGDRSVRAGARPDPAATNPKRQRGDLPTDPSLTLRVNPSSRLRRRPHGP